MHRRARHLNPGSAGAVLALDSRFITGLSDGDPVSTWTDRSGSGNDATGSGTARPTFEINEQAGQPTVRFNGAQTMLHTLTVSSASNTSIIIGNILINKSDAQYGLNCSQALQVNYVFHALEVNGSNNWGTFRAGGWRSSSFSCSTPTIMTLLSNSSGGAFCTNGTIETHSHASFYDGSAFNTDMRRIGSNRGVNEFLNGNIFSIIVYDTQELASSLRRRLEHAAAFSFKIPCS